MKPSRDKNLSNSVNVHGSKVRALWGALLLAAAFSALSMGGAMGALSPFERENAQLQMTPRVMGLLEDADKALAAGNVNLALLNLKDAVRLAPANGDVHWRLGDMWL